MFSILNLMRNKYNFNWRNRTEIRFKVEKSRFILENKFVKSYNKSAESRKILSNIKLNQCKYQAPNNVQNRIGSIFKTFNGFIRKHNQNKNVILCGYFHCRLDNIQHKSLRHFSVYFYNIFRFIDILTGKGCKNRIDRSTVAKAFRSKLTRT